MKITHVKMIEPPKREQLELWPEKAKYMATVLCNCCNGAGGYYRPMGHRVIIKGCEPWTICPKCEGKGYTKKEVDHSTYVSFLARNLPKSFTDELERYYSTWALSFLR